jgi:glycosyltransferase involved in cell wall biosynthesis
MPPKISIIIPTFNGEKKIQTLLHALQKQTIQDFECLIIIDGSTDKTQEIVEATPTLFKKTILNQHNQGRSVTKNNGARHSMGELLIFFDDDMEPNSRAIELHFAFHQNHRGMVTGNQTEPDGPNRTDIQNYKAALTSKWTQKYSDGLSALTKSNLFFAAANCSMPTKLFWELGGFDERLTDAEDYDLAMRAIEKNIPVYFDKSNSAIHHDIITCRSYINRTRQYQAAQQKLRALHPDWYKDSRSELSSFKKIFYWTFSFSFWPKLIDNTSLIMALPKFARYKIYDWVIHSQGVVFPWKKI